MPGGGRKRERPAGAGRCPGATFSGVAIEIGQQVLARDPDGDGMVKVTVVESGEPSDAVEMTVEGKPIKRDVAIIRYDEGGREGLTNRCRDNLLKPV
jgi:hypothetical protein